MMKTHPEFQATWIDCACSDKSHSITVEVLNDEEDEMEPAEFCIEMQIQNWRGFFKRLWIALCYLLKKKCRFGAYDCFTTSSKEKLLKIRDAVDRVIEANDKKGWEIPTKER